MSIDRRRHARLNMTRPCKVVVRSAQRFLAARTTNVSVTGALIEVLADRPLSVGEVIDVAISWNDAPIVRSSELVTAEITRALVGPSGTQTIGVRFASQGAGENQLSRVA
ncbi:MAG: PilZ domain-containing protein [Phycisphaerales bacterium]|jgi:hypothetical protein|nr:PilZ domain-containing protein [Phycisphaerales bacterium]